MKLFTLRIFKDKLITVEADRVSVCAGDDMRNHNKLFKFNENIKMEKFIEILISDKEYSLFKTSAIWAGDYENYKCVKDNNGNWMINKDIKAKVFFKDIRNYVCFERWSKMCEK